MDALRQDQRGDMQVILLSRISVPLEEVAGDFDNDSGAQVLTGGDAFRDAGHADAVGVQSGVGSEQPAFPNGVDAELVLAGGNRRQAAQLALHGHDFTEQVFRLVH